jgi:hypothetical protein
VAELLDALREATANQRASWLPASTPAAG